MAAHPPLSQLVLAARSVADDLGYVALADLSQVFEGEPDSYRVIGGHMVTALVGRWSLGAELYRETGDTDLGVPPVVIRHENLVSRLEDLGYVKVEGNRFAKVVTDVPVRLPDDPTAHQTAIIDVLVGAYTSRARQNRKVGDIYTTEVPGLPLALKRPPVAIQLTLHRMNGEVVRAELSFPDELSALILKAFATTVRTKGTDVVDLWRCLEVAFAAGVGPSHFNSEKEKEGAEVVRRLFRERSGPELMALITEQRLSVNAADARFTRLRALVDRVLGLA